MLKYRLILGPAMIALLLAVIYFDNRLDQVVLNSFWQGVFHGRTYLPAGLLMLAFFLLLIPFGTIELATIFRSKGVAADPLMLALAAMLGCGLLYAMPSSLDAQQTLAIFATVVAVLLLAALVRYAWPQHQTQGALAVAGATLLALCYMGILPGFFILIRRWHSAWIILAIILITKCCDIGAYFTGRSIGRHKLIPWLSPGKTWEGLIGGMLTSALAAVLLGVLGDHLQQTWGPDIHLMGHWTGKGPTRLFVSDHFSLVGLAAAGLLLGLVGQFGDLVASLFKRDAGIKDSGSSIPGFGGLLDVADSPLVVAPLAYWMLTLGL